MIKANEIRIGNMFHKIIIESITKTGVNFSAQYEGYLETPFDNLKPILLTEEVLIDFGFAKNEDAGNWNSPTHRIYSFKNFSVGIKENYIGWYNSSEDDFYSSFYPKFEFVHQLQNFFFCLTGNDMDVVANGS